MSKMSDRFKGMNKADVKSSRLPSPSLGKGVYKIDSVRMHDNTRTDGFRVEVIYTCLYAIANGTDPDGNEVQAGVRRHGQHGRPGSLEHVVFGAPFDHAADVESVYQQGVSGICRMRQGIPVFDPLEGGQ